MFIFILCVHSECFRKFNVAQYTPPPSPLPILRSETKLVFIHDFDILKIIQVLCVILFLGILWFCHNHSQFNPRFMPFSLCTNLQKRKVSYQRNYSNLILFFLTLSYVMLFDLDLIILLPSELFQFKCSIKTSLNLACTYTKRSQNCVSDTLSYSMKWIYSFCGSVLLYYPCENLRYGTYYFILS